MTPRITRIVRVPDLRAMHAAVARLAGVGGREVRGCAVLVPTRGAARELQRTFEGLDLAFAEAFLLPDLLTRADFYERLHAALTDVPPMFTPQEREVLLRCAARRVSAQGPTPPFRLRPGLILQMLAFYDELRRREQSLDDFSRLTTDMLGPSVETDRGAERLLRQSEFLAATFSEFEQSCVATGRIDEHALRALLLNVEPGSQPTYQRVVVTVADQAADPHGLYASDFDVLARMPGLSSVDVVATESLLASGFLERLHDLMPGIEDERIGEPSARPVLVTPETSEPGQRWFIYRDREEELAGLVRELKHRAASPHDSIRPGPLDRCAVVFQRPLPYLYLARQVFADGGIEYEAMDALPLDAEPFAAAVDIVLSFLIAEANRGSIIELLSSPHFAFSATIPAASVSALDELLQDLKYAGGWDRLSSIAAEADAETKRQGASGEPRAASRGRRLSLWRRARAACAAAAAAASALQPVRASQTASDQLAAFLRFIRTNEQPAPSGAAWEPRHLRARAAVLAAIEALRDAHARHDDEPLQVEEVAGALRRWIESQTFAPHGGAGGLRLLDASSAPYADVDELRIVGLVDSDWPQPVRRSIFYPAAILSQLGWPRDATRGAAARAQFHDLLNVARRRISASLFTLEDDAIVAASPLAEELETSGLSLERQPAFPPALVFEHELVMAGLKEQDEWLQLRQSRRASTDACYRGAAGARESKTYAVSAVERYLECPFKYYAAHVLQLPEERDEETGLTPQERGQFVHEVFERFFQEWHEAGERTITTANVAAALDLFERVVDAKLESLPEADRALERTHLLGSAAASGLAERAFAFEMEQGGDVVERLLEHSLEGSFTFTGANGPRKVSIRAKADRIDLMAEGTLRVIDYKLSKAPKLSRGLQLTIYGVAAEQALEGHSGRSWKMERAGYVAFREKDAFVPLGGRTSLAKALAEGQQRFLEAIDAIERGDFPVDPDEPFRCRWCGYASVCRKDYVGDE